MITVEIERADRITLRSPYSTENVRKIKSIPGASWNKILKVWTYPLSLVVCKLLRETFGLDLQIGPVLWRWAVEKNRVDAALKEVGKADDADLHKVPVLAPTLFKAMGDRTYQRSGARFLADRGQALNLDDLGLGKTATSLAAVMESGGWEVGLHLVISPSTSLRPTWANQILRWTNAQPFVCDGSADKRHQTIVEFLEHKGPRILIVNPEMLRARVEQWCNKCKEWESDLAGDLLWDHKDNGHKCSWKLHSAKFMELLEVEWDSIIADECKYLVPVRPHSAKRMPQQVEGLVRLKSAPNGLRLALTGTPFRGREWKIFGLLCWSRPQDFKSFWQWVDTYFKKDSNGFGITIEALRPDRIDMFYHDLDINCLRRTRQEVRADLPINSIVDVWVDMHPVQKKMYNQWINEGFLQAGTEALEAIGILAELTRARQLAFGTWGSSDKPGAIVPKSDQSPKLDYLMGMLEERDVFDQPLSEGVDKIIVVSQFTQILNMIYNKLEESGVPCLRVTGSNKKSADGLLSADVFQAPGGPRVLLLNTDAGGVSLTLDEFCDEMVILDEKFVDDDQKQVMGRIDNRGRRVAPKFFYFIRTKGTVEEGIANMNASQDVMQRDILDGRRGVEFLVNVLKGK